jgi:multidrug efflux pump subunit AcrB
MAVRVRPDRTTRDEPADIANMRLLSPLVSGGWIPLSALASLELRPELGGITRRDSVRVNKILGFARPGALPIEIANDVVTGWEQGGDRFPPGYYFEVGGETENQSEAVGNLMLYLPVLVVITVAVLILSFRNARIALILLTVAPLSVGYGLLATWMMQFPLSFNTVIGSLGLMGLAFNSSIIVLAGIRANDQARRGDPLAMTDVMMSTGRHLLSTTLTTIGSFLPFLLFVGGEFWPPLAIVLAGGVGGSTLLALTFTPALYRMLLCRKEQGAT